MQMQAPAPRAKSRNQPLKWRLFKFLLALHVILYLTERIKTGLKTSYGEVRNFEISSR